jgi:hypothetical protein
MPDMLITHYTSFFRRIKRKERNEALVQFILTDSQAKEYLCKVYNGKSKSDLHTQFMENPLEKWEVGFGPIDDEDQVSIGNPLVFAKQQFEDLLVLTFMHG